MRNPTSVAMIASAEHATSAASCERSASAARCAVMSRAIVDAPTIAAVERRASADTVKDTATGVPSRRSRSVENCSMCSPCRTRRASSACSSRRVERHDQRHRTPDRLVRRVAVETARTRAFQSVISTGEVDGQDRIVRAADDRREALRIEGASDEASSTRYHPGEGQEAANPSGITPYVCHNTSLIPRDPSLYPDSPASGFSTASREGLEHRLRPVAGPKLASDGAPGLLPARRGGDGRRARGRSAPRALPGCARASRSRSCPRSAAWLVTSREHALAVDARRRRPSRSTTRASRPDRSWARACSRATAPSTRAIATRSRGRSGSMRRASSSTEAVERETARLVDAIAARRRRRPSLRPRGAARGAGDARGARSRVDPEHAPCSAGTPRSSSAVSGINLGIEPPPAVARAVARARPRDDRSGRRRRAAPRCCAMPASTPPA